VRWWVVAAGIFLKISSMHDSVAWFVSFEILSTKSKRLDRDEGILQNTRGEQKANIVGGFLSCHALQSRYSPF
jgi:hypothetical protein